MLRKIMRQSSKKTRGKEGLKNASNDSFSYGHSIAIKNINILAAMNAILTLSCDFFSCF
jgi:hypothetical protein